MPLSSIRDITNLNVEPLQTRLPFTDEQSMELAETFDFNFDGVETQYATHGIHTYVAAMNPPLARTLITNYVPEGATVLDPFCGGGGVLVEALLNGRRAVGYDVNPLAALISRAKTTYIPQAVMISEFQRIVNQAWENQEISTSDIPDVVRFWYHEGSLIPLRALQLAVSNTENASIRDLFYVVLSATARDVMLTYRGEIRLRRLQGQDLERFKPDVFASFSKRASTAIERVAQLPIDSRATIEARDIRQAEPGPMYHSVITSPPYADDTNGVGYFQFSRNMLYWLGFSLADLKEQRRFFLGCGNSGISPDASFPPSETLRQTLGIIEQRSQKLYKDGFNFYRDYYQALTTIANSVEERVIIIIGDRVLSRTQINNGHITTELMGSLGFGLEHYYTRELKKKRIANLGGDGGGTSIEHILVYKH